MKKCLKLFTFLEDDTGRLEVKQYSDDSIWLCCFKDKKSVCELNVENVDRLLQFFYKRGEQDVQE